MSMWLFIAFLAPVFYGWSSIFDNFLANQKFKNPLTLAFYTSLFNIVFLPIVFLIQKPTLPAFELFPIFVGLGLVNVLYLYPYYRGLQVEDTSITISFFSFGRIFIPILAYFIIGEIITIPQYIGIFLIIMSGFFLSLSQSQLNFRFSNAFGYMMIAAFIVSLEGVLLKYLFEHGVQWSAAVGGEMAMSFLIIASFLIHAKFRKNVAMEFVNFKRNAHIFGIEEGFTFLAFSAEALAIKLAPVSLAKSISTFTPLFVLFYAFLFSKHFPFLFKEKIDSGSIIKKIVLFIIMIFGVLLLVS